MHDPYTKETGPTGKIFDAERIPPHDSWWVRRCNGKRYYLQDPPKMFFGKLMVWIYEEGKNKVLHIPAATLLKRYDQYTKPHKTVCDGTIIKH